ncbi:transposase [Bifidobacterium samirii]|uniref:Transposase n=1 Tax=Bifidobacterium samirii TaxID=2306974 RepID=A0A430FWL9_9BIFI|nr:transposase [Bifidobacterium samirii]
MTGKTRYTKEFQAKALRLLEESRANHSSETKAVASVAQSLGISPETLRRWRNKADRTAAAQCATGAEEAAAELKRLRAEVAQLRRANEILTTASAFFAARLDPTRR